MLDFLEPFRELNIYSMMLRSVLAVLMGGMIGLERERKRRPAGFRTYILVAIGAAMTMMLSQYLELMLRTAWSDTASLVGAKTDVSRIGSQVINGVGFLGAGTIIVTGQRDVKGLTTAVGLWASACMGLALGAGFYECVLLGFTLMVVSMVVFPAIEGLVLSRARNMNFYVEMDGMDVLGNMVAELKSRKIKFYEVELDNDKHDHFIRVNASVSVGLPRGMEHTELLAFTSEIDGVRFIEEH